MQGALAAYPHLGCTGGPYEVWKIWGVSDQVLCAGNDSVLTFIDDVLSSLLNISMSEVTNVRRLNGRNVRSARLVSRPWESRVTLNIQKKNICRVLLSIMQKNS